METAVKPEPRTYYSRASHLIVKISNPVKMIQNGVAVDIGGKDVSFNPLGDGWGWYVTTEPDEIAVLDANRMVVGPEVYNDMTTPDHVKVKMEREENQRLIVQRNSLLQEIERLKKTQK